MIIEITGVTSGQSPYDFFICDVTNTACFFVSGNTTFPGTVSFDTENYFPNIDILYLRAIDANGCVFLQLLDCGTYKIFQDDNFFLFMDGLNYLFQ
jgi:hypothetical protein